MNKRIIALLAAIVSLNLFPVSAEDAAHEAHQAEKAKEGKKGDWVPKEEWDKLTDEQKAEKMKERRAKMEAQLKELRAKKAAGTLTDKQAERLERMEKRAQRADRPAGKKKQGDEKHEAK
jgi:hypothetical protein